MPNNPLSQLYNSQPYGSNLHKRQMPCQSLAPLYQDLQKGRALTT